MRIGAQACVAIVVPLVALPAIASDEARRWDLQIGAGIAYTADYPGASATNPRGRVWADGTYRTDAFGTLALDSGSLTVAPELRWDFVDSNDVGLGVLIGYRSGRSDSNPSFASIGDGSERLRGLPTVNDAADVGVSGHVVAGGLPLFAQVRSALTGSQGVLAVLGTYLPFRPVTNLELTILPTVTWSDARQMRAFFGVSPAASMASGLPSYVPGSGWQNAAIEVGADWQFDERWHLIASLAYQRLLGAAARSPIVQTANQPSALVGVAYSL